MTTLALADAPRRVLLLTKSQGQFKHSGKYYLHNGRWHKLHADKPAPKGSPVASHKHAAGEFVPKQHFSDEQWQQLQLPAENVNAGTFNKQLAALKQMSDTGDVTGILGAQFGSNTYGKKLATIANKLLEMYGSEHQVTAGQKAGEHGAVSQAPADLAPTAEPAPQSAPAEPQAELAPTETAPTEEPVSAKESLAVEPAAASGLAMPEFAEGKTKTGVKAYYEKVAQKIIDAAGDQSALEQMKADGQKLNSKGKVSNTWAGKTANSKTLLALHEQALKQAAGEQPAAPAAATDEQIAAHYAAGKITRSIQNAINEAVEDEDETSLNYFATQYAAGTEVHEAATAALAQLKANTSPATAAVLEKPKRVLVQKKPEPAPAVAPAPSDAASNVAQIPWDAQLLPDSNKNAKSHNKQVGKIKALTEAGDLAGLEALKFGTNTYGKKQEKLKQVAIAALKEAAPAPAPAPAPAAVEPAGLPASQKQLIDDIAAWPDGEKHLKEILEGGNPAAAAYAQSLLDKMPAAAEQGPKEGDTKPGADGMLVFKNGRWHKFVATDQHGEMPPALVPVDEPEQAAAEQHPLDAVPMPELNFKTQSHNDKAAAALEKLKEQVKAEGPAALKGATKKMSSSGKLITTLPGQFGSMKVIGYEHSPDGPGAKVYAYVEALKAAAGKPKKAPKAKAAPAPVEPPAAPEPIESIDSWTQTGPQGGSNPGGKFKDESGTEWYCKFPSDPDVAKSEILAAKLYAAAGVTGQDAKLITKDGKIGIASKWTTVSKASPAQLAKTDGVLSGFGTDAWLANWDVVGLGYDNLQVGADGNAVRVDAGGSLTYRAQGGKKAFGTSVTEIDSLRDGKINPQAAAVFGKMTDADISASVAKVLAIPDATIRLIVQQNGPGDLANRKALAEVLIARKNDLAAKYPQAKKAVKKRLDPTNLPIDADRLPKAHDFNNWLGQGKPLSSQPHVNAANMAVEQELLALAKTGNLTKLKEFKYHQIDKATGNATGQLLPIANHPSKHVVQLHADLVMTLDEIANPPQPLKIFNETDVGSLEELAMAFPPKAFGTTVNAVHSNEKLGFWVVLGGATGAAQKFKPAKVMNYTKEAIAAAHEKFKQASKLARHFITSVQASGSYNDLFRNGMTHDHQGNKLSDVAQAALEHATTMPEGTSLYRWQNMSDEMVKKIMSAPDGTVFQATGPMCTSYSATATSGFGQHRVTIRYAKGAKGVESFGSGKFAGEKEVTTLPNSRFVILSKEMVPNEKNPSKKRLELEVLMLPPDLGMA